MTAIATAASFADILARHGIVVDSLDLGDDREHLLEQIDGDGLALDQFLASNNPRLLDMLLDLQVRLDLGKCRLEGNGFTLSIHGSLHSSAVGASEGIDVAGSPSANPATSSDVGGAR